MQITRLLPKDLQQLLDQDADGIWGPKTAAAVEGWFGRDNDLLKPTPIPQPGSGIVPADWMPDCTMTALVNHWTGGAYTVSEHDKECYHIIIGGDLKLVRGDNSIKANVATNDADGYAAHTRAFNTRVIGIAVAAMANAKESPFNPGTYPITKEQWLTSAQVAAELCRKYNIRVTPKTVLQHGEVQKNLGIVQNGKWDVCKLPWQPSLSSAQVCDMWRAEVMARL